MLVASHRSIGEQREAQLDFVHEFVTDAVKRFILAQSAIQLLLKNLVDNALRYTPSGGVVRVETRLDGDSVRVSVSDTGPGIAIPDDETGHERIFEAFVTSKAHGTGLGLPMVQQVALDHGGSVRLVETGPTGTTFEFSLPACDPPRPSVSSPNPA